jgi:penicillin-insensitive murein endopeptidase
LGNIAIMIKARQLAAIGRALITVFAITSLATGVATAQDKGTLDPKPLPPLAKPDDPATPAKELFARRPIPTALPAHSIGFYAKGCLAGAAALPINGKTWQVMRLSRNRNWGHPAMVRFLEQLSERGAKVGWRGLLVGDMSQPRGGPMITGHASHQVGLDADIWFTPMPARELTRAEREEMSATMIVANDRKDVDPKVWAPAHGALIKTAAQDPQVQRIFVNPAI